MELPVNAGRAAVVSIWLLAGMAHAQLPVTFIGNAATYSYPPLPNSSIAQGSFFVVLGSVAPALSATTVWSTYPLPTTLAGTAIAITVGGTSTAAFIYYVGPSWDALSTQIDAVVPS